MEISANVRRAPLRLSTGAFVLNSGISAFNADEVTTKRLQTSAAKLVPQVERMNPQTFAKVVAAGEVTLGTALMLPVVPAAVAGLGLSAFAASMLATRGSSTGEHVDATERTEPTLPNATDAWMLGAGVSLLLDALTSPAHDKSVEVSAKLHEKAAARRRLLRRSHLFHDAGERVTELRDGYQPVAAKKLKKAKKKARKQAKHVAAAARAAAEGTHERIQRTVS